MTLFAVVVAALIVLVPSNRSVADEFESVETVLTALGATYATILALVLTLSIIPIQRAGEAWSASILRLYRHDWVTYTTFMLLGLFCVTSFLLAVRGLGPMPVNVVLAASFTLLGISLDLLRWYHGHVCLLLDPEHAVSVGLNKGNYNQSLTAVMPGDTMSICLIHPPFSRASRRGFWSSLLVLFSASGLLH